MPAACNLSSSSASASAAVTSTLVTGSAATTTRRTGVGDAATACKDPVLEQLGIGEEQRRIPAEQHQAGDQARVGIARDVVIALDAVGAAENGGVRPPAVPQELDDGDHDRQADSRDRAQHRHADEAARSTARTPSAGCDRSGGGRPLRSGRWPRR